MMRLSTRIEALKHFGVSKNIFWGLDGLYITFAKGLPRVDTKFFNWRLIDVRDHEEPWLRLVSADCLLRRSVTPLAESLS